MDQLALDQLTVDQLALDQLALDRHSPGATSRRHDRPRSCRGLGAEPGALRSGRRAVPARPHARRPGDRPCICPWWALAVAFALTEVAVVHVNFRRSSHSLALSELPLAARAAVLRSPATSCSAGWWARPWGSSSARAVPACASPSTSPSWRSRPGSRERSSTRSAGGRRRRPAGLGRRAAGRAGLRGGVGAARRGGDVDLGRQHRAAPARRDGGDGDLPSRPSTRASGSPRAPSSRPTRAP